MKYADHIKWLSERMEREPQFKPGLGDELRAEILLAWRKGGDLRSCAQVIINRCPSEFPLIAERQAD
jgi:hypothetical protein